MMIEGTMFFALGFLAASLLALIIVPLVHNRAERLAIRRIEGSVPLSVKEVMVSRDQLRAAFAVSTRRLENQIEQLRARAASLMAELGKKSAEINRRSAESQPSSDSGDQVSMKGARTPAPVLVGGEPEVASLKMELAERSRTVDAQRIEIVTLKVRVDTLNFEIARLQSQLGEAGIAHEERRASLRLAS
jgi:seryl-tRNA synthetase